MSGTVADADYTLGPYSVVLETDSRVVSQKEHQATAGTSDTVSHPLGRATAHPKNEDVQLGGFK